MTDELVVRPYAEGDRAGLLELLRQVWPNRRPLERHVDRRWWWQHSPAPLLLIEDPATGTLGGLCAYMPFRFATRGREWPAAWFVDFYVLPALQGRGLGQRLTRAVQGRFPLVASLSQTAMAWRVFQKLGWRERSPVQLAMHPWPQTWMFRSVGGWDLARLRIDADLSIRADLDAVWSRVKSKYAGLAVRTSDDLLRRYSPHGNREYDLICARRGAICEGYAIVRAVRDGGPGLIVDVLADPQEPGAFSALVAAGARRLIELGATRLYCLVTPPLWRKALARCGFLSADTPLLGWRLRSQTKWLTWHQTGDVGVTDSADWFVTLGDCDLDAAWAED